jgi:predicted amidohydrolase
MAWKVLPEARAIENQVYFCACNQTGKGLIGNSKIISYDGSIVKSLEDEEDILTAEIDLDSQNEYRQKFPILKQI